jgi:preprotein translocase subunit SecA
MVNFLLRKLLGSKNQREIKKLMPLVAQINEIEQQYQSLSDDELRSKTTEWKGKLSGIQDPDKCQQLLEQLLPEAFAAVKNASRRLCGRTIIVVGHPLPWEMVHFDAQLLGGIVLHRGKIAEMATGEGKTLVATLPLYLNALTGRGAHLVTVNDYLARRDAEWVGEIFRFLGLTVGILQQDQSPEVRRAQYACDITYGTNSEFGFDYLRDNGMAASRAQQVQRGHAFAIVDEVDSILIDEARTPLIISGPSTVSSHQYGQFKPEVAKLVQEQSLLCNQLIAEVKTLLEANNQEEAGRLLFKVKLGEPRNKGLLRLLENPDMRRLLDRAELVYYQDTNKQALVELKEEIYFVINERQHEADLTEKGRCYLSPNDPDAFMLPDLVNEFTDIDLDASIPMPDKPGAKAQRQQHFDRQAERIHNISQLLKAYCLYEKNVEYVVEENKVLIVDQFTGRKMPGRRWSDGLHQAVEAKEDVHIEHETQTLATITIQNYFRLYEKLAGMTGTAETEANEFHDIYLLDVVPIPTNRPIQRTDLNDRIYKTRREKYNAVIREIKERYVTGQPILVGTGSVEASELLSRMLKREKIPHNVLNAKYHLQEAEIVARAGQKGAVTISTNMAGRGTDIKLGPNVQELGGLHVIGTERHESRRIDRQLRGRCSRQGDPGSSQFFVSFEDDLMRNFGSADRMIKILDRFGMEEGEELEHPWLNKSVETAQKRVEQRNYLMRKRTLEFDDVMNQQRGVIYAYRNEVLETPKPRLLIWEVIDEAIPQKFAELHATASPMHGQPGEVQPNEQWEEQDYDAVLHWANQTFPLGLTKETAGFNSREVAENITFLVNRIKTVYEAKASLEHPEGIDPLERYILLNAIDRLWQEHLYAMDGLREGVQLRSYGQKDPLVEFKAEAFKMFSELMVRLHQEVLHNLFRSTTNLAAFENFLIQLQKKLSGGEPLDGGHRNPKA